MECNHKGSSQLSYLCPQGSRAHLGPLLLLLSCRHVLVALTFGGCPHSIMLSHLVSTGPTRTFGASARATRHGRVSLRAGWRSASTRTRHPSCWESLSFHRPSDSGSNATPTSRAHLPASRHSAARRSGPSPSTGKGVRPILPAVLYFCSPYHFRNYKCNQSCQW